MDFLLSRPCHHRPCGLCTVAEGRRQLHPQRADGGGRRGADGPCDAGHSRRRRLRVQPLVHQKESHRQLACVSVALVVVVVVVLDTCFMRCRCGQNMVDATVRTLMYMLCEEVVQPDSQTVFLPAKWHREHS